MYRTRCNVSLHPTRRQPIMLGAVLAIASSTAWAWDSQPAIFSDPAEPLVRQAIAAGLSGDALRKTELLAAALQQSPDYAPAHWQSGEVRVGDRWLPLATAGQISAADPRLDEYRRRRATVSSDIAGQLALAKWCQAQGLEGEARAHFTKVLEIAPGHEGAIAALKLKKTNGQWMTQEQMNQQEQTIQQYESDLKKWKPVLQSLAKRIEQGSETDRDAAIRELQDITDPRAIIAMSTVCLKSGVKAGREFVSSLAAFPQQAATEGLLRQAVMHGAPVVRSSAMDALKSRSLHDYVPILMAALQEPLKPELSVDVGAGSVQFTQAVRQEGAAADKSRSNELEMPLHIPNPYTGFFLREGLSVAAQADAKAEKQARVFNRASTQINERIYAVLAKTTGQELDRQPRDWWTWWQEYNDVYKKGQRSRSEDYYHYQYNVPYYVPAVVRYTTGGLPGPKPALSPPPQPTSSPPPLLPPVPISGRPGWHWDIPGHSYCFAPGTKVWTLTGPVPIETLQAGDRVLSQDPSTGELAYKPILRTTLLSTRRTVQVQLGRESIVATRGHLFWIDTQGWKMARELQPGMRLHGIDRDVLVDGVQDARIMDVYNLVVADFATYFVGESRVLVHDNSERKPTLVQVPGLAPAGD